MGERLDYEEPRTDEEPSTVTIRPPVQAKTLPIVDALGEPTAEVTASTDEVFPQSIASGGPSESGVILWTRIDPEVYLHSRSLFVEITPDESFETDVVARELASPGVKPDDNYTVRVDFHETLEPNTAYYYRFVYAGIPTRIGRCRTLPEASGTDVSADATFDSIQFGLLNCQNYQNGYFGAMAHLANADVDFVLHLGDYIYEHVVEGYPRGKEGLYADRQIDLPDGETLPMSLDDFRHIYQTYKADRHLQRLHERHTVIQTWDDHAIANDRYWSYEKDAPVFPKHPCGDAPEFTRYLTRVGIQAWWEFIPARIRYDPGAEHIHDSFTLYHAEQFGDLVSLVLTDERLFRSKPLSFSEKLPARQKRFDPSRTMLGADQHEWFTNELRTSETQWTVWANAVLFTPFTLGLRWMTPGSDSWDGYEAERASILETFEEVNRPDRTNIITLTGDMHTTLATRIQSDGPNPTPVGIEFMTPGVTSVNFSERVAEKVGAATRSSHLSRLGNRYAPDLMQRVMRRLNDEYTILDSAHWGYSIITFTHEECTWDVYWVDKTQPGDDADREHVFRVRVPADTYEIQDLSDESRDNGSALSSALRAAASAATRGTGRTRVEPKP